MMMMGRANHSARDMDAANADRMRRRADRSGFSLPLILVLLAMMVQVAYQLNESMVESARRAAAASHAARARDAAISGLRLAAAQLTTTRLQSSQAATAAMTLGTFPLPTPDDMTTSAQLLAPPWEHAAAWPLEDESAKLAIHALPLDDAQIEASRDMLLNIPLMTVQTADAILDWLDVDDRPRPFGAEQSYYAAIGSRLPRNGRIAHLEELLAVRGVTPELLFGDDRNGDGRWDQGEGGRSANGSATEGWVRYLSTVGREENLRRDGSSRVYLNIDDATDLYDRLEPVVGSDMAIFLAALRKFGPFDDASLSATPESPQEARAAAMRRAAEQLGQTDAPGTSLPLGEPIEAKPRDTVRGGVDLGGPVTHRIRSLADVCGVEVQVTRNDEDAVLLSPWPADANGYRQALKTLEDLVTVYAGDAVEGRINVQAAPWQVLAAVPGMPPELARAIASRRSSARGNGTVGLPPNDVAWLLESRLMDWSGFREAVPFFTSRGDVFTVRCLGTAANNSVGEYLVAQVDAMTARIHIRHQSSVRPASLRAASAFSARQP